MGEKRFEFDEIFSYNNVRNKVQGILTVFGIVILFSFIAVYYSLFRNSDFFLVQAINGLFIHVSATIKAGAALGIFYTALFGGLFFIFLPLEATFILSVRAGQPGLLVMILYLVGFAIAYTANYYIGRKLNNISKKLISPRKFYKLKGLLNRRGSIVIYLFNAIPLAPSQPLSAILGVFKYNKSRFYSLFLLGQLTKYGLIVITFKYLPFLLR